ncbi:hypothetical protein Tco_0020146 [Tanacetum coccineum]
MPKKKQLLFPGTPSYLQIDPHRNHQLLQNNKPNVPINLSTEPEPATESRKPMPKSHTRTASIRESGTSVLEDLKALSWKTCQEEQTATGKEISNPFLADSLLKTIRLSLHLVIATKH